MSYIQRLRKLEELNRLLEIRVYELELKQQQRFSTFHLEERRKKAPEGEEVKT